MLRGLVNGKCYWSVLRILLDTLFYNIITTMRYFAWEMLDLETSHSQVCQELNKINFLVQLSETNPFGRCKLDIVIKTSINKNTEIPWELTGFSTKKSAGQYLIKKIHESSYKLSHIYSMCYCERFCSLYGYDDMRDVNLFQYNYLMQRKATVHVLNFHHVDRCQDGIVYVQIINEKFGGIALPMSFFVPSLDGNGWVVCYFYFNLITLHK